MKKELIIGHLFPNFLNLYGDLGNIMVLKKRAEWRGINIIVRNYNIGDKIPFSDLDIIILGGGSDKEQILVCRYLQKIKNEIGEYIEKKGVLLAICGGYQILGNYYNINNIKVKGLGILDFYTEAIDLGNRLIGNICIESFLNNKKKLIVGFENHNGKTYHNYNFLGIVKKGFGNNGKDGYEGLIYKNIIATYLHGPLLPKNPEIADYLLQNALYKKYGHKKTNEIISLEDNFEINAKKEILKRLKI